MAKTKIKTVENARNKQSRSGSSSTSHKQLVMSKQHKQYKTIDRKLLDQIENMIEGSVKLVCSRSKFIKDEQVQEKLKDSSRVLKARLKQLKVPKCAIKEGDSLQCTLGKIEVEMESQTNQIQQLQQAIRTEKRKLEELEELQDVHTVKLLIQVPEDELNLPQIV